MIDPPSASDESSEPLDEQIDEQAPPPMVIVGVSPPERPVGRVIGEMSPSQAQHNAVTISCGLNLAARRSATNELFHHLMHPLPPRRRRESDVEVLAGPAHSRRSEAPHGRVEIWVEVGDQLVMVAPGTLDICVVGRSGCDD
jgi:hypothetical protein